MLSTSRCSCRRSTCDRRRNKRKHIASSRRGGHLHSECRSSGQHCKSLPPHHRPLISKWCCVLLTTVARLAWSSSTGRGAKTIESGTRMDELLRREPAHFAHRQPEAVPEEPEEQRVDALQVVSEPNLRWSNACLNFHSRSQSERWLP